MKQLIDDAKVEKRAIRKSPDDIASALLEKVRYGDQSSYLDCLSVSEMKKTEGRRSYCRIQKRLPVLNVIFTIAENCQQMKLRQS